MGEKLSLFRVSFNKFLRIESGSEQPTGKLGAMLLREILERTRIIEGLAGRADDRRNANRVTYPVADLPRTARVLLGQGWRDQDDTDALRYDAGLRLATSSSRGTMLLSAETHQASQFTLSRRFAV
jgi:hypothetical protein